MVEILGGPDRLEGENVADDEVRESQPQEPQSRAGRKPKYSPELNNQAYEYCLLGANEKELAAYLGISVSTLNVWKNTYPEFSESIKKGKKPADAKVAHAIFDRATGARWIQQQAFKVKEIIYADNGKKLSEVERIEIVDLEMAAPPDTTACIFILKNRDKENWKDKQEVSLSNADGGPFGIYLLSREEAQARLDELRAKQDAE